MRIIDKNTDFYDYLQNVYHDNSIVFDRNDSFLLTKEMVCHYLGKRSVNFALYDHDIILLQVCNTFWLFLTKLTEISDHDTPFGPYKMPTNYDIELLATWKNYDKKRELIKLDIISLNFNVGIYLKSRYGFVYKFDREKIIDRIDTIIQAINTNDYRVFQNMNYYQMEYGDGTTVEKHIPLLKACGIANIVDPLDIYLSLEEYFSVEKTVSERTESVGITDKEKIENHGFDTKTSFRGKNK